MDVIPLVEFTRNNLPSAQRNNFSPEEIMTGLTKSIPLKCIMHEDKIQTQPLNENELNEMVNNFDSDSQKCTRL
jgi:hypothetical protein